MSARTLEYMLFENRIHWNGPKVACANTHTNSFSLSLARSFDIHTHISSTWNTIWIWLKYVFFFPLTTVLCVKCFRLRKGSTDNTHFYCWCYCLCAESMPHSNLIQAILVAHTYLFHSLLLFNAVLGETNNNRVDARQKKTAQR